MKKHKRFAIKVNNKVETLPEIADFIKNTLEKLGADAAILYKVQLAVDEACTNIINYAYSGAAGPMTVAVELAGNDLVITIQDKGQPFDVLEVPPPDLSADLEDRKIGGLGIYFVKKLMDEVSYSSDANLGNTLTFRKRLVEPPITI